MKKALTCVVTHEYFQKARTMIRSFLTHNDGYDVVVFSDIDMGLDNVRTVSIDQQAYQRDNCSKFERIEMIRPQCHLDLLGMGYDAILYCDSDIYFTGRMEEFQKSVFTPHHINAIGKADPRWVINDGYINIGIYFLVKDTATVRFLRTMNSLSQKVERGYNTKPHEGYWQQCLYNYLPWFHSDYILSDDETVNVAYWNIGTRHVSFEDGIYKVNGKPMTCYHFSGWTNCNELSMWNRSKLDNDGLKKLYQEYQEELEK